MTTPAEIEAPADAGPVDIGALMERLAAEARANAGSPVPFATGTFAFYPMEDGGIMCVTAVVEGPLAGTHHSRLKPGLIRAVSALIGGGGKISAIKGLFHGRRQEIGQ